MTTIQKATAAEDLIVHSFRQTELSLNCAIARHGDLRPELNRLADLYVARSESEMNIGAVQADLLLQLIGLSDGETGGPIGGMWEGESPLRAALYNAGQWLLRELEVLPDPGPELERATHTAPEPWRSLAQAALVLLRESATGGAGNGSPFDPDDDLPF